jgi:hypothetical protein
MKEERHWRNAQDQVQTQDKIRRETAQRRRDFGAHDALGRKELRQLGIGDLSGQRETENAAKVAGHAGQVRIGTQADPPNELCCVPRDEDDDEDGRQGQVGDLQVNAGQLGIAGSDGAANEDGEDAAAGTEERRRAHGPQIGQGGGRQGLGRHVAQQRAVRGLHAHPAHRRGKDRNGQQDRIAQVLQDTDWRLGRGWMRLLRRLLGRKQRLLLAMIVLALLFRQESLRLRTQRRSFGVDNSGSGSERGSFVVIGIRSSKLLHRPNDHPLSDKVVHSDATHPSSRSLPLST